MLLRLLALLYRALRRRTFRLRQQVRWLREEIDVAGGSFVAPDAVLGRRVRINRPSFVDRCEIGPYTVAGQFVVRSANHLTQFLNMQEVAQRRVIGGGPVLGPVHPVRIGAGCWIGDQVIILEGVEIGDGAVIGAGAVVTRSVPPYAIAVGNPARVLRFRFPEEIIELITPVTWWTWSDEKLRANKDLFELDLAEVDPEVLRSRLARL